MSGKAVAFGRRCAAVPGFKDRAAKCSPAVVAAILYYAGCRKVTIAKGSRLYDIIQKEFNASPGLAEKAGWPMGGLPLRRLENSALSPSTLPANAPVMADGVVPTSISSVEAGPPFHSPADLTCGNHGFGMKGTATSTTYIVPLRPPLRDYTTTVLPYGAQVFEAACNCDFNRVTELIQGGPAPINAVDPYHLGLLYHAAYYGWRNEGHSAALLTCRALCNLGIDVTWVDEIGSAPVETILDGMLMTCAKGHCSWDEWAGTFREVVAWFHQDWNICWKDYMRKRSFSRLHEVVLQTAKPRMSLADYLQRLRHTDQLASTIDVEDSQGRTALTWAAEYHDFESASLLVAYGANVNHVRRSGKRQIPILHLLLAAKCVPQGLLKLLLEAGADINAQDDEGWTAVHIAASWRDESSIDNMMQFAKQSLNKTMFTCDYQTPQDLARAAGAGDRLIQLLG